MHSPSGCLVKYIIANVMSIVNFKISNSPIISKHRLHARNERKIKRMPGYKDEKTNTWYCKFYYVDWNPLPEDEARL